MYVSREPASGSLGYILQENSLDGSSQAITQVYKYLTDNLIQPNDNNLILR